MASHEEIKKLAYELWEKDSGKKESEFYWHQAEYVLTYPLGEFVEVHVNPDYTYSYSFRYFDTLDLIDSELDLPQEDNCQTQKNHFWRNEGF